MAARSQILWSRQLASVLILYWVCVQIGCAHGGRELTSNLTTAKVATRPTAHLARGPALVVGNNAYLRGALENGVNDATAIATKLTALGFTVKLLIDANLETTKRALANFKRERREFDGIGLFYFAGHGLQIDGKNYLVPIDALPDDPESVEFETLSADAVLAAMAHSKGVNIAIFDACRNNPFPSAERSGVRGLAMMDAPSGMLIAYATAPGETTGDGHGPNGTYTARLLEHIDDEGLTVEQMLKRTNADVRRDTAGAQRPWMATDWPIDVYLNPKKQPNPEQLFELARANARAGEHLSIVRDMTSLLDGAPLTQPQLEEARRLRDQAEGQLALLSLKITPDSAMVRVDGTPQQSLAGELPLNPGTHHLEVSNRGYRTSTRSLYLRPGSEQELALTLERTERRAVLPWTLGAFGVASLTAALATGLRSRSLERALEKHCDDDGACPTESDFDWRNAKQRGHALAVASDVMLGVGITTAISSALIAFWPRLFGGARTDSPTARLSCSHGGCMLAGRFVFF